MKIDKTILIANETARQNATNLKFFNETQELLQRSERIAAMELYFELTQTECLTKID